MEDLGLENFTCTGMTYDQQDDSFWIADHGTESTDSQRLIEIDETFQEVLCEIRIGDLTETDGSLQGIAFDSKNNNLWIAIGSCIYNITKDGEIIKEISASYRF